MLRKFGLADANTVSTPADCNVKLVKDDHVSETTDQVEYQSMVGSLLYIAVGTRPDIAQAVGAVSKFCSNPTEAHKTAVKRIFRYLKKTTNLAVLPSGSYCLGVNIVFGQNSVWLHQQQYITPLYGLKQAPRCWNRALKEFMMQAGFVQSSADPCVFTRLDEHMTIVWFSVWTAECFINCSWLRYFLHTVGTMLD